MADDKTAALVVALSAQLTKFEKDMTDAVKIADRKTKEIETTFSRLNTTVTGKLSEVSGGLVSSLGFAGQLLTALGPIGIAAAVGIGATVAAMTSLSDATDKFAEKAKALKEGAETAGLTISQFKALGSAGKAVGLDFEETSSFFIKYIANIESLRKGSGPLFEALLKIDAGLARDISTAKTSAEAIDLLVAAMRRLTDQSDKLALSKGAGGRGGLQAVRLLESMGERGISIQQAPLIDEGQIERAAQLKVEIEAINKKTATVWGGMFSDDILARQKNNAEIWNSIANFIDRIVHGTKEIKETTESSTFVERFGTWVTTQKPPPGMEKLGLPAAAEEAKPVPAAVELEILRKNTALLGEAITQGEQYRLKKLEIAAAVEAGGIAEGVATRALNAFNIVQKVAAEAVRERLAIANEQQIAEAKLAQLELDRAKFGLSDNEVLKATVVILREAKQAAEALEVRRAYLPGLKQLELDARSLQKGLDVALTSSLNSLTEDLTALVTGTKTAKEAFTSMVNSILNDIVKLTVRQVITGPLAGLLGGIFSGPAGAGGIQRFAGGTSNAPGGWAWVGEQGPELVNLPRGAQVIPNVTSGFGGTQINNSFMVAGEVSPGTVDRLANAVIAAHRKIDSQAKIITSTQRFQATGVS